MSLERAKADLKYILNSGGFQVDLTFESPSLFTADVKGIGMKHHNSYDTEGNIVSGKLVHLSVIEQDLIDEGYTTRDANNEVSLLDHRVTFTDSSNSDVKYKIVEQYPDETVGMITFIAEDYNG